MITRLTRQLSSELIQDVLDVLSLSGGIIAGFLIANFLIIPHKMKTYITDAQARPKYTLGEIYTYTTNKASPDKHLIFVDRPISGVGRVPKQAEATPSLSRRLVKEALEAVRDGKPIQAEELLEKVLR